jgi:hypothetical protein
MSHKPTKSTLSTLGTGSARAHKALPRRRTDAEKMKMTVFLPMPAHKRLVEICVERNTSQQQIWMEAFDGWMLTNGEPTIAELVEKAGEAK